MSAACFIHNAVQMSHSHSMCVCGASVVIVCLICAIWCAVFLFMLKDFPCVSVFGTMVIYWYIMQSMFSVLFCSCQWGNELAFKCGTLCTHKKMCIGLYETEQQQAKIVPFVLGMNYQLQPEQLTWLTDVTLFTCSLYAVGCALVVDLGLIKFAAFITLL